MEPVLELRCPNRPCDGKNEHRECRSELAGPFIDTLKSHNFSKAPFRDTRRCPWCKIFFEITIIAIGSPPTYRVIPKEERIDFVSAEDFFGLSYVQGRKITRRGN